MRTIRACAPAIRLLFEPALKNFVSKLLDLTILFHQLCEKNRLLFPEGLPKNEAIKAKQEAQGKVFQLRETSISNLEDRLDR